MTTYKVFGQVRKPCSPNGHWTIRILDKEQDTYDTQAKLDNIHARMKAYLVPSTSETAGGLIKPVFGQPVPEEKKEAVKSLAIHKPYNTDEGEFVVKVPTGMRGNLPEIGTFVCLTIKPRVYKFEKNKHLYIGWNAVLRKFSIHKYTT